MINFTVGPVQADEIVREIGAEQVPYFRTAEFSKVMLENEELILKFANAPKSSRAVFMTGSGTASMEAAVINTLTRNDRVLVVNGGSFGQRFVDILSVHKIEYTEIKLNVGQALKKEMLDNYNNCGYTAFAVNVGETSTGVHYDMDIIGDFCKKNGIFLIVDAISSFLADDFDMDKYGADIMITGSQKALACPPGISIIALSPKALERVNESEAECFYLNLKSALKDGERGQTPFTPAVGILLQINARLRSIDKSGGASFEIAKIAARAEYFRNAVKELPFTVPSESMSNAVTPLHPLNVSANDIFLTLKDEYGIWVCPNGGALKDEIFRVGHIGELSFEDYDKLLDALKDMLKRGLL